VKCCKMHEFSELTGWPERTQGPSSPTRDDCPTTTWQLSLPTIRWPIMCLTNAEEVTTFQGIVKSSMATIGQGVLGDASKEAEQINIIVTDPLFGYMVAGCSWI
jgi:hypothetical protein